jgi:hypothetical protein
MRVFMQDEDQTLTRRVLGVGCQKILILLPVVHPTERRYGGLVIGTNTFKYQSRVFAEKKTRALGGQCKYPIL